MPDRRNRSTKPTKTGRLSALVLLTLLTAGARDDPALRADEPTTTASQPAKGRVVSMRLVARPSRIDLDGDGSTEAVWTFNRSLPGPEIRARVGDVIRVRFRNRLPVPSSIHWHGIELSNRMDGTTLTQHAVPPGGSFRYTFQVTRPGVYWYHPHVRPSNQVFRGLYGALIVTDDSDDRLTRIGFLPRRTQTVVLSDVTVCKEPGENDAVTYPADPNLPWAGQAPFPGHAFGPTPKDLCETPLNRQGRRLATPLAAGEIPNVQPLRSCLQPGGPPCRVNPGQWVLVNGRVPAGRGGDPASPGDLDPDAEPMELPSGAGVRLQVVNASLMRFFRLRLTDADGALLPVLRIGGQGGLLDRARIEGGVEQGFDTLFERGELVIGPSERQDLVIFPAGDVGDVLTLWTRDFGHTGRGFAQTPTVPLLHFRIADGQPARAVRLVEGTRLLRNREVDRSVENLRSQPARDRLLAPADLAVTDTGSTRRTIRLTNVLGPSIDDVPGIYNTETVDDFRDVPFIATSRFARVGDLLRLEVANETSGYHVFHLHGFAIQPVRYKRGGRPLYRFPYREFVDSVQIPGGADLVFKVRLDDRPVRPGSNRGGGAVGRWLFHCHLYAHAALGMISELVVLPRDSDTLYPRP